MTREEQIQAAAAVVEAEGNDFTFGKPDERDFVRMVLRGAGLGEARNGDTWLEATAEALYADMGETVQSPEDMARFVLDRCWNTPYTEEKRMNDYVGPGIFADVTWYSRCSEGLDHVFGRLSHRCMRCSAAPKIEYRK